MPRLLRALAAALVLAAATAAPAPALAAPGPADLGSRSADVAPATVGGEGLRTRGTVLPLGAPPVPEAVVAHGWVVADLDTGEVLAAQDPHGRYAPASTLKTLTAVALIPELDPDLKVVPAFEDVAVEGSKVGLVERVGYPVHELFSALMMVSGNDAANTLVSAAGGPAAIDLMNETARRLGALDTHAVNGHGLDAEGQTSSAYDLALIARAGVAMPDFVRYATTRRASVSGPGGQRIEMYNKNKLLGSYEGALGIKNGYTSSAKASFVGAAERDGRRLVVTLMRTQPKVFDEAAALLDWGFAVAATDPEPVGVLVDPVAEEGPEAPSSSAAEPAEPEDAAVRASPAALRGPLPEGPASPGWGAPAASALAVTVLTVALRRRRVLGARRAVPVRAPVPARGPLPARGRG